MIFVVRVTTNREEQVIDLIADRARKKHLAVYSLIRPHGLRGYILLEALDHETAEESAFNLPYVKGIISRTISYPDIENLLEPAPEAINIEKNDIVEIISEPFKKEKAKVIRIDKSKEEVVVELLAAVVPMPVTVKIDNIRVIRRDKAEGDQEATAEE